MIHRHPRGTTTPRASRPGHAAPSHAAKTLQRSGAAAQRCNTKLGCYTKRSNHDARRTPAAMPTNSDGTAQSHADEAFGLEGHRPFQSITPNPLHTERFCQPQGASACVFRHFEHICVVKNLDVANYVQSTTCGQPWREHNERRRHDEPSRAQPLAAPSVRRRRATRKCPAAHGPSRAAARASNWVLAAHR